MNISSSFYLYENQVGMLVKDVRVKRYCVISQHNSHSYKKIHKSLNDVLNSRGFVNREISSIYKGPVHLASELGA